MGAVSFRWKLNRDPELVKFIRDNFVAAAVDISGFQPRQDPDGEFYRTFRSSYSQKIGKKWDDQGIYVCDTAGKCYDMVLERDITVDKLKAALGDFRPVETKIPAVSFDTKSWATLPEGGLLLRGVSRHAKAGDDPKRFAPQSDGGTTTRDNLWVRKDEGEQLAGGQLPSSLVDRLIRFHLVDLWVGSPPSWEKDHVKHQDMKLTDGVLRGSFRLERDEASSTRSAYQSQHGIILGFVETKDGRIRRLDMVVKARQSYTEFGKRVERDQAWSFTLVADPSRDEESKLMPGVLQDGKFARRYADYLGRRDK
ncbi:hypothetical protein BH23PLA1_BH23PLA1_42090 [soil metagenome]